jgi:thiamine monophosphate kinase
VPRLREGKILADRKIATAMIDVSDGLLSDLKPIGEESRSGP